MTSARDEPAQLRELARLHGVQLGLTAQDGTRVRAGADTLRAILSALGHSADDGASVTDQLVEERRRRGAQVLEPVLTADRRGRIAKALRVPSATDADDWTVTVELEGGGTQSRAVADAQRPPVGADGLGGTVLGLDLRTLSLPPGYHVLRLDGPHAPEASALLLVPPPRLRTDRSGSGVVAPTYALRGRDDWGVGTYRDLGEFADLVGSWGGDLAGTLPLYPTFFTEPVDPSPYLPVSRLFWNEMFLDLGSLPEFASCAAARELAGSTKWQRDLEALRALPDVDYAGVMARKRQVLEQCASTVIAGQGRRRDAYERHLVARPDLVDYADFRAAAEGLPGGWRSWSGGSGGLPEDVIDAGAVRYHRYVQFVAAEQLAAASGRAVEGRAGLYLDLPVGVHPDGYDTWSRPEQFADAGVGAPPDRFFAGGQSWGFPPPHPERIREQGYEYLVAVLRHVFGSCRTLRIDHVLGLQRLYWVPHGFSAQDGAYVRYHDEELRAVVAIEADRADAVVVGEDLGTVSPKIRHAMDRDGFLHSFVYQFAADADDPLPQPTTPSVASVGNHDLVRFAGFVRGSDISERHEQGILDEHAAERQTAARRSLVAAVLRHAGIDDGPRVLRAIDDATVRLLLQTCLIALAEGPATYLLADLADLELQTIPDNRPGTGLAAGNWRRRIDRPLAAIAADPALAELMTMVTDRRAYAARGVAS